MESIDVNECLQGIKNEFAKKSHFQRDVESYKYMINCLKEVEAKFNTTSK